MAKESPFKSGRFVLRVSPDLHTKLSLSARNQGVSLNEICNQLLLDAMQKKAQSNISEKWVRDLVRIYEPRGLKAIVLFGSVARGTQTESSDVDLLLVMDQTVPIQRGLYRFWDDDKVNLHFVHLPSPTSDLSSLWLEVLAEGKTIYVKDPSFQREFSALKQKLWDGTYRRKQSHGHGYWVKGQGHEK